MLFIYEKKRNTSNEVGERKNVNRLIWYKKKKKMKKKKKKKK